jgi:hypothetical protein
MFAALGRHGLLLVQGHNRGKEKDRNGSNCVFMT